MARGPGARFLLILCLWLAPVAAQAQGIVSSADPRASEAGREMLRAGGSATDAAMAMMLALTVVEPQSSGIGGGGFLLHHDGRTGKLATIDGRETAPASARPDRFLAPDGSALPFKQAYPGGLSVGVPGNIALMAKAHAQWGQLPWARLFDPAIRLARQGFAVNAVLASRLRDKQEIWANFPEARAIYWREGAPAREGMMIANPALADLLEQLARQGPSAFYHGAHAQAMIDAVAASPRNPATITAADLAGYEAKQRPPVCGRYRVYRICGMGPPSSGAVAVLQILGMLERFDLRALGKDNPKSWHLIAEAMRLAYADRDTWLGDADFVEVPVAGLIAPGYLRARSALIAPDKAAGRYLPGQPRGAPVRRQLLSGEIPSTTHFIAVDGEGNIASMTSTIEGPFGSQLVANGMFLNNELTDFSFQPEKDGAPAANRVQPGKRPLSSMAPTIVYDRHDKPVFVVGAAGGRTIIMQVAKALIARLDWGLDPTDAIGLGLVFFNADGLVLEQGSSAQALKAPLEAMGHVVSLGSFPLKANAAGRVGKVWQGAADPRSPGVALAQ